MSLTITDPLRCTGCAACMNSCPKKAITMSPDEEGFLHPAIAEEKCVECGLCREICPVNHPPLKSRREPQVFAAWHRDNAVRGKSSSGGAFSALAETILARGGVVFGAAYAPFPIVRHTMIDRLADLPRLRASKYVQSAIGNTFQEVRQQLEAGREVLFVGTPCQVMGLKKFLSHDYELLTTCDLICHGVPSPQFFTDYIAFLAHRLKAPLIHLCFRNKNKGWYDPLRIVTLQSGKTVTLKGRNDFYFRGFSRNITLRESCYCCPGVGIDRAADLTIADFWGIGKSEPFSFRQERADGISLVIIHSVTGERLWNAATSQLVVQPRTIQEAISGNQTMIECKRRPPERDTFYRDFYQMPKKTFFKRHFSENIKTKLVAFLREYCPRFIILTIRKLITKDIG